MQLFKEMLVKLSPNLQSNYLKNITKEVSLQSVLLVWDKKKDTTIFVKYVRSQSKHSFLITDVMLLVLFWPVVQTSRTISTKLICLTLVCRQKSLTSLMFHMGSKTVSTRLFKSQLKLWPIWNLSKKSSLFPISLTILLWETI